MSVPYSYNSHSPLRLSVQMESQASRSKDGGYVTSEAQKQCGVIMCVCAYGGFGAWEWATGRVWRRRFGNHVDHDFIEVHELWRLS